MNDSKSQLKVGLLLNYINLLLGSLIPLFYTPIMLHILGQEEYGLYKLSGSITSYLSLIAFGLGAAITRYLIKARIEIGEEEERKVLGLFIQIFRVIALLTILTGIVVTFLTPLFYSASLSSNNLIKMQILITLLAINTAINFLASPYISIVNAHERFLFLQSTAILSTCLGPILNLIALFLGYASLGLAVSSILATIVLRILFVIYVQDSMHIRPIFRSMPKSYIKDILGFSLWIFISNIVGQLYEVTYIVLIGAVPTLSTIGVAVYNIGMVFNSMISSINAGLSSLLLPKANKMVFSEASPKMLTDTAIRIGRIQTIILSLFIFGFIAFGRPFIYFYAGNNYADSYWIAILCMIPNAIPLVQSFCLNIVIARNENKFRALTYLFIAILNVIATWYALKLCGVIGAAIATSVAGFLGAGIVMNWFYKYRVKLQIGHFWISIIKVLPPVILLCGIFLISYNFIDFYNIVNLICGILIFTFAYIFLTWVLTMNNYEKDIIKNLFHK